MAGRGTKMENYYMIARLEIQSEVTKLILQFLEHEDNNEQRSWPTLFAQNGVLQLSDDYAEGIHEIKELCERRPSAMTRHVASNITVDPGMDTISASARAYVTKYVGNDSGRGEVDSIMDLNITARRDEGGRWRMEFLEEVIAIDMQQPSKAARL